MHTEADRTRHEKPGSAQFAGQIIRAEVPLAEVLTYASQLKSMTGGQGSFTMDFKSYDPVPPNVQLQIVDRYKKSRAGIEEE